MSTPQDPFAAPGGEPPPSGQPPAYGQAPTYGQPPAYGQAPAYGQQGFFAPPSGGQSLASWLQRVGATLVDLVISAVLQLIVGLVSPSLGRLAGFALALYFAYLVGTTGQTPGKRALGMPHGHDVQRERPLRPRRRRLRRAHRGRRRGDP